MEPVPTFVPLEAYNELLKKYNYMKIDNELLKETVGMLNKDLRWRRIDNELKAGLYPFKGDLEFHKAYPARRKVEFKKRFVF